MNNALKEREDIYIYISYCLFVYFDHKQLDKIGFVRFHSC